MFLKNSLVSKTQSKFREITVGVKFGVKYIKNIFKEKRKILENVMFSRIFLWLDLPKKISPKKGAK